MILERGERLAGCPEGRRRDADAIFARGHFRPQEDLGDARLARRSIPGNYYYVGGNSKLYGAVLIRYRAEDFRPIRHLGGTTPGWPISYDELEPWYQRGRGRSTGCAATRGAGPDRAAGTRAPIRSRRCPTSRASPTCGRA